MMGYSTPNNRPMDRDESKRAFSHAPTIECLQMILKHGNPDDERRKHIAREIEFRTQEGRK